MQVLNWEERLHIALDISHGIEYLHEGAVPPVIHRDLKSANILLDHSMRAKVREQIFNTLTQNCLVKPYKILVFFFSCWYRSRISGCRKRWF